MKRIPLLSFRAEMPVRVRPRKLVLFLIAFVPGLVLLVLSVPD